ncbi:MAG: hypothetical protein IJB97_04800 [Clostridia bacterium]|nr:hypothetical protein [Clostridia bacterium]
MDEKELKIEREMKGLFAYFLERGFSYLYTYEKGGDSSCSYIYRFAKGKDFFDLRELSGGDELNFVVFVGGQWKFPSLAARFKKEFRAFRWKHLFKKPTKEEKRAFFAELLIKQAQSGDFFGLTV